MVSIFFGDLSTSDAQSRYRVALEWIAASAASARGASQIVFFFDLRGPAAITSGLKCGPAYIPTSTSTTCPDHERQSMSSDTSLTQLGDQERASKLVEACQKIRNQVSKIVVGQDQVVEELLIAILARGHCLLEGVPGLAKTLMVRSLAEAMDLSFQRIQFTPDLMPADITGTDIIQENRETGHRDLVFDKGPIFTQMLESTKQPDLIRSSQIDRLNRQNAACHQHTTDRIDEEDQPEII